jgi:hypothetical protein
MMMMMMMIIIIIIIMLLDVAVPGDRNVIKGKTEKILKYKDLIIEIQGVWKMKAKAIPVITGATGIMSKSLRQCLSKIPGENEIKELPITATFGTSHILRKILM